MIDKIMTAIKFILQYELLKNKSYIQRYQINIANRLLNYLVSPLTNEVIDYDNILLLSLSNNNNN